MLMTGIQNRVTDDAIAQRIDAAGRALLDGLRVGARVQSAEGDLRIARQAKAEAERHVASYAQALRDGDRTATEAELRRLEADLAQATNRAKAARVALDGARASHRPVLHAHVAKHEPALEALIGELLDHIDAIVVPLEAAGQILHAQRAGQSRLTAEASRLKSYSQFARHAIRRPDGGGQR